MTEARKYLEDEVDLRALILDLWNGWPWIALCGIVAAVVVFSVTSFMPKQYRTSATLVLTKPDVIFRFDPRIQSDLQVPSGEGIPNLALSSGVLSDLMEQIADTDGMQEFQSYESLRNNLEAVVSGTILTLTAQSTSPSGATSLANTWGTLLVRRINEVYAPSLSSTDAFEAETMDALTNWRKAQDAYISFQRQNRERVLLQRLTRSEEALSNAISDQHQIDLTLANIATLQSQLSQLDGNQETNLRQDLVSLVIAINSNLGLSKGSNAVTLGPDDEIVSLGSSAGSAEVPFGLQLSLPTGDPISESVDDQIAFLVRSQSSLRGVSDILDQEIAQAETDILSLQGELAEEREQRASLEEDLSLAREAYQSLARKAQESRISETDQETVVKLASAAAQPRTAVAPRRLLLTVAAGALGFLIGAVGVVLESWWSKPTDAESETGDTSRS